MHPAVHTLKLNILYYKTELRVETIKINPAISLFPLSLPIKYILVGEGGELYNNNYLMWCMAMAGRERRVSNKDQEQLHLFSKQKWGEYFG